MNLTRSVLALAFSLLFSTSSFSNDGAALLGERLFIGYCASCHGSDAKGDGVVAAVLAIPVPDLTTLSVGNGGVFPTEWVYETIDGRADVIAHGPRDMPVWGLEFWWEEGEGEMAERNVRRRIEALVDYIESIQATALKTNHSSRTFESDSNDT